MSDIASGDHIGEKIEADGEDCDMRLQYHIGGGEMARYRIGEGFLLSFK